MSMTETAISIWQDSKRTWRGKCASDPQLLAAVIRKRAPECATSRVRDGATVGVVLPEDKLVRVSTKSTLAVAIGYALGHWTGLWRRGHCELNVPAGAL